MQSSFAGPVNIGSEEMISINALAQLVMEIAGKDLHIQNIPGPTGVRGRNSNNLLIGQQLGWQPSQPLRSGLEVTYRWIERQVASSTPAHRSQLLSFA
jgi:nucleoside-diphosphate-sugar epimerase